MRIIWLITAIILIAGCSNTTLENDEVLAVVKGEEITMGELRFLSDASDEKLIENIDYYVEEELILQEAKAAGIDVTDEVEKMVAMHNSVSYKNSEANDEEFTKFIESQAERFDMAPEEYFEEYMKLGAERSAYHNQFINEKFGTPEDKEEAERIQQVYLDFIKNLKEKYKDEIEILVE